MTNEELKQALENDEIHYSEALEILKSLPKPWHTKEWRAKRDKHLKDQCEVCGSKEGPLVIQHTKQPWPFKYAFDEVYEHYFLDDLKKIAKDIVKISDKEVKSTLKPETEQRSGCPKCSSLSIRYRRNNELKYACTRGHEFSNPKKFTYYPKSRTKDFEVVKMAYKRRLFLKQYRELKKLNDREIGRITLLITTEQSEEYLSFKDIKTCCKKCAYKEDLEKGNVKKNWARPNTMWKFSEELF